MDAAAETLMRSMIHDLANTLSGIHGILEIQDPGAPLSPRTRSRLDAVILDGLATLERSRHLAMGTVPGRDLEPGAPWRRRLQERLAPLGTMFGCTFNLTHTGEDSLDQWPGELLLSYIVAVTRQVLPYLTEPTLRLSLTSRPEGWSLAWAPLCEMPETLQPGERSRDTSARWALNLAEPLGITCTREGDAVIARLRRP